jgi:hypothetical protein
MQTRQSRLWQEHWHLSARWAGPRTLHTSGPGGGGAKEERLGGRERLWRGPICRLLRQTCGATIGWRLCAVQLHCMVPHSMHLPWFGVWHTVVAPFQTGFSAVFCKPMSAICRQQLLVLLDVCPQCRCRDEQCCMPCSAAPCFGAELHAHCTKHTCGQC